MVWKRIVSDQCRDIGDLAQMLEGRKL
jgi:hypothetical protein